MQLIITKENEYLELEDTVVIKANEFGVWFWEDFYNIDAKKISEPVDFSKYTNIYEDLKGKIMTLHLGRELAINTNNVLLLK